jgi:prevent-host-death family protein
MTILETEDCKPVSELKRNTATLLKRVRDTGRPLVLTTEGKAEVVLMDAKVYSKYFRALRLRELLSEGERDLAEGRVRPFKEFLRELKNGKKVSR